MRRHHRARRRAQRGRNPPGTNVLVFGCGGVGLSIIQGARIAGAARIIAVDNNTKKLDMAANLGATDCILSPDDPADLVGEVHKLVPRGVEVAFDAVGMRTDRLQHLMAATDLGGLTLAVGVLPMTETVPVLGRDLLLGARRLAGVRGGNGFPGLDIPRILKLYAAAASSSTNSSAPSSNSRTSAPLSNPPRRQTSPAPSSASRQACFRVTAMEKAIRRALRPAVLAAAAALTANMPALAQAVAPARPAGPRVAAWDSFTDGIRDLPSRMLAKLPVTMQQDPRIQQEIARLALASVTMAGLDMLASDGGHPSFVPQGNSVLNVAEPNPDTIYRAARINPGGTYRLRGRRGSCG